ncbi:PorA family porin [Corynebacterium sp.]|nr:PorA family porin [Corynebacterium sp.]
MEFLGTWNTLSSEGILGGIFKILEPAGDWAGAAADLIGLVI